MRGRGLDFELRARIKVVEGHRPDEKEAGFFLGILGDPMRWNIGRLASSRGRVRRFERVECIRVRWSVARNFSLVY